jgi:hypothetical protein
MEHRIASVLQVTHGGSRAVLNLGLSEGKRIVLETQLCSKLPEAFQLPRQAVSAIDETQ